MGFSDRIRFKAAAASSRAQETLEVNRLSTSWSPRRLLSTPVSLPMPGAEKQVLNGLNEWTWQMALFHYRQPRGVLQSWPACRGRYGAARRCYGRRAGQRRRRPEGTVARPGMRPTTTGIGSRLHSPPPPTPPQKKIPPIGQLLFTHQHNTAEMFELAPENEKSIAAGAANYFDHNSSHTAQRDKKKLTAKTSD